MAEIKSAVEIAMERTKGLRLSLQEREKIKEEELQSKARALINRFLETDLNSRETEKDLDRFSPEERVRVEKFMVRALVEALDLDKDNETVFQGLETLAPGKKGAIPKVRELTRAYGDKKGEAFADILEILRKKWADRGVSGSAVVPKAKDSPEFAAALKGFRPSFQTRLAALQKEILEP